MMRNKAVFLQNEENRHTSIEPVLMSTPRTEAVAFICELHCFSNTDLATAALGSHLTSRLHVGTQHVIRKEKNSGALSFHSSQSD